MRYKHKVDWWIGAIMWGSILMFIPLFWLVPEDEIWILAVSMIVMAAIILPFFSGYIELRDDDLYIKMHVFHQSIPYDNIKSVRLVTNFLSSMAMTARRIEIKEHDKGFVRGTTYIGPVEREDVYDELLRRCRNLED